MASKRSIRAAAMEPGRKGAGAKRVCILTAGGDAPGLNAVIRSFVKTCVELGIEVLGSEDGFEGLIEGRAMVELGRHSVRGILPRGGSILGCSNRANPFAYTIRENGEERVEDVSPAVIQRLRDHDVDILVMVGGDGTMYYALEMMRRGMPVVGVPKTIDNDLGATDTTFGFDTAVHTATWAVDALHSTAESHDRVIILELMGRYAGWIALHAGIAGGADAIAIPEIPYDPDRIAEAVMARSRRGTTFSIVVVGEGAHPVGGGHAVVSEAPTGQLARLGGAAEVMANLLKQRVNHEIRVTVLGHLQRGGSPSSRDRLLGTRFGTRAALMCAAGETGQMVSLRGLDLVAVPIETAVNNPRLVDPEGELVQTARHVGIEMGAPGR